MAICPVCQNTLQEDFGLVECGRCGAALLLEIDGTVRQRDSQDSLVAEASGKVHSHSQSAIEVSRTSHAPPPGEEGAPLGEEAAPLERTFFVESNPDVEIGQAPSVLQSEVASQGHLEDIAAFANSEESAAREGHYSYDLSISGIDSADIRQAIKELLNDQRFLWDVEALMRTVHEGELHLRQIGPAKAALVVQRLNVLPVQVKWVQHVLVVAFAFLFSIAGGTSSVALASEGGGEAAKAAAGEAGEAKVKAGGDSREYVEYQKKESHLNTLRSRIEDCNQRFAEMVKRKSESKDTMVRNHMAELMMEVAKERNQWTKEYNELRQEVLYKYPSKGKDIDKRFAPGKEKGVLELEKSSEIDALLSGLRQKIDKKYAPLMPKTEVPPPTAAVVEQEERQKREKKKLRLVK